MKKPLPASLPGLCDKGPQSMDINPFLIDENTRKYFEDAYYCN